MLRILYLLAQLAPLARLQNVLNTQMRELQHVLWIDDHLAVCAVLAFRLGDVIVLAIVISILLLELLALYSPLALMRVGLHVNRISVVAQLEESAWRVEHV